MNRGAVKFIVALALLCLCTLQLRAQAVPSGSTQAYSAPYPAVRGPFSWADRVLNNTTIAKGGEVYQLRSKIAGLNQPLLQIQTYDASFLPPRNLKQDLSFFSFAINNKMYEEAAALLFADSLYPESDTLSYLRGLLSYELRDFARANTCFVAVQGPGILYNKATLFTEAYSATPEIPQKYMNRSPLLAGALSAVIPGAGKIYAGDLHSGVSTFLVVGALGAMTAESWVKLGIKDWRTISLASIFSLFYIGNIYGSYLSVSIIQNTMSDAHKATLLFDIRIPLHEFR